MSNRSPKSACNVPTLGPIIRRFARSLVATTITNDLNVSLKLLKFEVTGAKIIVPLISRAAREKAVSFEAKDSPPFSRILFALTKYKLTDLYLDTFWRATEVLFHWKLIENVPSLWENPENPLYKTYNYISGF